MTRNATTRAIVAGACAGVAACWGADDPTPNMPPAGATTGGDGTTFNHDNNAISLFDFVDRVAREGPPSFTSRLHSCLKLRYQTLGNVLTSVGIDITNPADPSAGKLYRDGMITLGAPNYARRVRENANVTTSGAAREFDLFATGADEVIAAVPLLERCKVAGRSAQLFDGNTCRADGITCLIGVPAQTAHVDRCSATVQRATDELTGKRLAVAALLAAAYTCE